MNKTVLVICVLLIAHFAKAQSESLLDGVEDKTPVTQKVTGAFKSTRVINAHSLEMLAKGNLDVRILHRFGFVSSGIKQFYGLDAASMRLGFDYGISDNVMIGIGRSTYRKEIDAFIKTKILQQTTGEKSFPFSLLIAGGYAVHTEEAFTDYKPTIVDRSSYYLQAIIGRKFSSTFSLQLSPIFVHTNFPFNLTDDQNIFAFGGGARYKVSKRMALTLDYHVPFGKLDASYTAPLSLGIDIETGGHVFQLHFSNATGMNERAYVTQTTGDFFKGDMRIGFNLSRIFYVGKKKKI
jgi:opacity protein-like surface antigen